MAQHDRGHRQGEQGGGIASKGMEKVSKNAPFMFFLPFEPFRRLPAWQNLVCQRFGGHVRAARSGPQLLGLKGYGRGVLRT